MKKLIALLMVCGFAMSFIACGGGSQSEADSEDSVATESPALEPAPAPEADTTNADTTGVQ
jgi:hypothetical protein